MVVTNGSDAQVTRQRCSFSACRGSISDFVLPCGTPESGPEETKRASRGNDAQNKRDVWEALTATVTSLSGDCRGVQIFFFFGPQDRVISNTYKAADQIAWSKSTCTARTEDPACRTPFTWKVINMSPPTSELFSIQDIPGAGRGVLASRPLLPPLTVFTSPRPAAHVIFRQYRKEVCAQCFNYDRGRTLPVKDNEAGKVFCSEKCYEEWKQDEGEDGIEAWRALETFFKSRSRAIVSTASQVSFGSKPGEQAIAATWEEGEEIASLQRGARSGNGSGPGIKSQTEYRKAVHHVWTQAVDPDIIGFLLSGILFRHRYPEEWQNRVMSLAMDSEPYTTTKDLEAHCNSFLQLVAIIPHSLLDSCTTEACLSLAQSASHNAFGIRAGGEDNEEYMGYSVYPEASYFNHSCSPNISKKRNGKAWEFKIARPVTEGEQLCISYLGGDEKDMTLEERRARLQQSWGFECMCERCKQEAAS